MRNEIQTPPKNPLRAILAVTAALAFLAFGTVQAGSDDETGSKTAANLPTEAEIQELYGGDGMKIPLDGSSLENFEASLELVKKHSTEDSFTTLRNSIQYLLVYDLEVRRNREALAAKLNGRTGEEVKSMVGWRRPAPGQGKADKGSSDPGLIDS